MPMATVDLEDDVEEAIEVGDFAYASRLVLSEHGECLGNGTKDRLLRRISDAEKTYRCCCIMALVFT